MGICGADCKSCGFGKNMNCKGCEKCSGKPFGKSCFIAEYIKLGGKESFEKFKKELISEINNLKIDGLPEIEELFALNGKFVNLAYPLPNGKAQKFLDDDEIYLGTQAESLFADETGKRCFGIVANSDFILVCEYGENGFAPEIILYKKR